MSTGGRGNDATIDLKANAETLKPGLREGMAEVEKFANGASKDVEHLDKTVEALEKEFKNLAAEIERVINVQTEETNATLKSIDAKEQQRKVLTGLLGVVKDNIVTIGLLTAVVLKSGGSMADKAAKVKGLISALVKLGAVAATTIVSLAGITTGGVKMAASMKASSVAVAAKTVSAVRLSATLAKLHPIIALVVAGVALMGVGFTMTGKKIELTNSALLKSQDLLNKYRNDLKGLKAELEKQGLTMEDVGLKSVTNWTKIADASKDTFEKITHYAEITTGVKKYFSDLYNYAGTKADQWARNLQEPITYAIKEWGGYFTTMENAWYEYNQKLIGMTQEQIDADRKARGQAKNASDKADKQKVLNVQFADDIKRAKEWGEAVAKNTELEKELGKVQQITSVNGIDGTQRLIEKHMKLQKELVYTGKFAGRAGDEWIAKYDAIIAREQEIVQKQHEWVDAVNDVGRSLGEVEKGFEEARREATLQNAPVGLLLSMLDDEMEKLEDIRDQQSGSNEELENQLKVVKDLKNRLHNAELQQIEERNRAELEGIEKTLIKKRQLAEIGWDLEDARIAEANEKTLSDLEKQGAGIQKLHETRMKFIDEEEKRELERMEVKDDEVAQARIHAEAEKKRIRELAQYRKDSETDAEDVIAFKREKAQEEELKRLEKYKASEETKHEERIKNINAEEARLKSAANTEIEKLKITAEAEKARADSKKEMQANNQNKWGEFFGMGGGGGHHNGGGDMPNGAFQNPNWVNGRPKTRSELLADAKDNKAKMLKAQKEARANAKAIQKGVRTQMAMARQWRAIKDKAVAGPEAIAKRDKRLANQQAARMVSLKQKFGNFLGNALGGNQVALKDKQQKPEVVKPTLERIADAAEETNRNEKKIIVAFGNAGALRD